MIAFPERREAGNMWEWAIFRWLTLEKKYPAVNLFDWPIDRYEGPRLHLPSHNSCNKVLLGDIFLPRTPHKKIHGFVEIKASQGFCWSDREFDWEISIKVPQYDQYLASRKMLDECFWLFFFAQQAKPSLKDANKKGCPKECPIGLFAIEILDIEKLDKDHSHVQAGYKYICKSSPGFRLLASYETIERFLEELPEKQQENPQIFDI